MAAASLTYLHSTTHDSAQTQFATQMRILSILQTLPPTFSGATASWLRLASRLSQKGIEVDVLGRAEDGRVVLQRSQGSTEVVGNLTSSWLGSYFAHILSILRAVWATRNEYCCVLFIGADDTLFATLTLKWLAPLKIAYRMSMLGEDDPCGIRNSGRFGWMRILLLRHIDAAICINPAMAVACQRMGISGSRVFTILQGTDVSFFQPATAELKKSLRERLGFPLADKIVLFCGSITHRKGVDLLLRAWPRILAAHPRAHLLIAGPPGGKDDPDGAYMSSVTAQARSAGRSGSVALLGHRRDIRELLQLSDIFALPSRMEGTPNVLLEAMAVGLPCITSDLPGISGTFVRHGVDGLLFPVADSDALASNLGRLLDDDILAATLGAEARRSVAGKYSLTSVADQYQTMFAALAER